MSTDRLLRAFHEFDPHKAEQIFNDEFAFDTPCALDSLAPVSRVALFAESFLPKVDGVSKTAYLTLRYLEQTGREVLVFAPDIAPTRIGKTQIVPMPSLGFPFAPESRAALPNPMINQYLKAFQPDLIHLFSPALLSVSGMLAGRRRKIPVIANYQTDLPAYAQHYGFPLLAQLVREWLRFVHNGCHLTLAPSNYSIQQLKHWGFKRLRRWSRGVNTTRFNPAHRSSEWRARLLNGRDPKALLCIYAGRLAKEKRVDLLLGVAQTPGVALTIIGDGAQRETLEQLFAGTGTQFMGYLYGENLAHAYASANVFIFPGPCETFGQVVQEAMASGLPAVVVNQGGVVDLVQQGETGLICPPDPQAFAQAAQTLRDNPGLWRQMAINARQYAEAHPWSAVMSRLEDYYHEAWMMNYRTLKRERMTAVRMPS